MEHCLESTQRKRCSPFRVKPLATRLVSRVTGHVVFGGIRLFGDHVYQDLTQNV
jgi:hypothetical protein